MPENYFHIHRDKSELESPIANSFDRLIRHHLGTAAFGSLLVASVQFFRIILSAIQVSSANFEYFFKLFSLFHLDVNAVYDARH